MLRSLLSLILLCITVNVTYSQLSPVLDVTPVEGTAPLEVTFSYTIPQETEEGGFINSIYWVPDWTAPTAQETWSWTFDEPGVYVITLGVVCKAEFAELCTSGQIQKSQQITIVVNAPEQVTAELSSTGTACNLPYNIDFTSAFSDDVANGGSSSYSIRDASGTIIQQGPDVDFSHNFTEEGEYEVEIWATNNATVATDVINVSIYPELTSAFAVLTSPDMIYIADDTGNNIAQSSATVTFQDEATPVNDGSPTSWVWDYGNGVSETFTQSGFLGEAIYDTPGMYTVTLTVSNDCGSASFTQEIEVLETSSVDEISDDAITFMTLNDGHKFLIDSECVGCEMNVVVVDALGNIVSNVYNGVARSEFTNSTNELPAGFYMYRIQLGDKFKTVKFVK